MAKSPTKEEKLAQAEALAPKINQAHASAIEATQTALSYAIDAGEMLNQAKKLMPHGEWQTWLVEHCPDISDRTARLYMLLAKNATKLEEAAKQNGNGVADLSIRGAAKLLKKPNYDPAEKASKKESSGLSKLERALEDAAPEDVIEALDGWAAEELQALAAGINEKLDNLTKTAQPVVKGETQPDQSSKPRRP
jgi:hypothetical protein